MKKLKFIIAALMLFACNATFAVNFEKGVEIALSQPSFKFDHGSGLGLDNNLGFGVGVSAKANFTSFDAGIELWYNRNTADVQGGGKLKCNAIDLPVVVGVGIVGPLFVEAGPSFSLLSDGRFELNGETEKVGRLRSTFGYILGLRVNLFSILTISGRFNGDFSSETPKLGDIASDMHYNAWTLGVGVKF